ncbi:MAG: hypothetical protein JO022_07185, partial [Acidobacteriaceae bacterium]|nr:hypothetical protein [Acidobacteriaceae bacterium]
YTGLSYKGPGRIWFRYMLEGFNHDWVDAGSRREAYYTNLPPGHYRFRVKACNYDGGCDATGTEVGFTLAARIWQRRWFWPVCVLLAAFGFWLAYQVRVQSLQKKFDLVLSERNRIARELHDTLLQGFSGVTMQLQALSGRIPSEAKSTLEDIIRDSAKCLKEARHSVAGLRSAQRSGLAAEITKAAHETKGLDRGRLKLRVEQVPSNLPPHVEYNLVKIAQEALTNAVQHSGARWIEVGLRATRGALRLSIQDDGSGLSKPTAEGHYGLIGMRERAQGIGADFKLSSVPGGGTTVSVALPLPSESGKRNGIE